MDFSLTFWQKLKIVARHPSFLELPVMFKHDSRIDELIEYLVDGFERVTSIEQTRFRIVIGIDGNSYAVWASNRFYAYATDIDVNHINIVSRKRPSFSHALLFWYVFDRMGGLEFQEAYQKSLIAKPK